MKFRIPKPNKWVVAGAGTVLLGVIAAVGLLAFGAIDLPWTRDDSTKKVEADAAWASATSQPGKRSKAIDAVRMLLRSQTDSALGRLKGSEDQRKLAEQVGASLRALDPKSASLQEIEAVSIYLLTGGSPRGLRHFIDEVQAPHDLEKTIHGALSYIRGDSTKARTQLAGLDASKFPALLRARLMLAQAALASDQPADVQKSILQRASYTQPGTLVEEAAIRRLINLSLKTLDSRAFVANTHRYVRRFGNSLYVKEFVSALQLGMISFESAGKPLPRKLLLETLEALPEDLASEVLLDIGRAAVISGLRGLCSDVGDEPFIKFADSPQYASRRLLYEAACDVVESPKGTLQRLETIQPDALDGNDQKLLSDAMRMAMAMMGEAGKPDFARFQGPEFADAAMAEIMVSATQQLQASNKLINEAKQ